MKYQLTSNQVASKVAGETVILNHHKGAYYGLDEVGVLVWDLLEEGPQTMEDLCTSVMAQYDVSQQTCQEDLDSLIQSLIDEKLVEKTI
ncbi:coenzyme PQQ synthesis protein D (PqqD) [Dyadobacter jejuensis]|uniref:Coenzyme PQQ synthesis protein D (PqqD) n=1 Tax=Dyadobacter jejuensis TaxID=1082580 RepID=A0A316B6R2_9BACT|nr:PqqD family peptide modification chaperone [Dyadobacter jejuensis]PWJ58237.1 coenzyme PQQ synthesis protein D (PqqD) [Dyadobacter jejuensis]